MKQINSLIYIHVCLNYRTKPEFSAEEVAEHARIGREYTIQSQRKTNALNKDLSQKIWLQQEAIRGLPEALRIEAVIIDDNPPPSDRPVSGVWHTPPIKDFDASKYDQKRETDDDSEADESSKTFES